jgi:hypothetical protein
MVGAAIWFVRRFGSEIPWADDWFFHVPRVSGEGAINREWLLSRYGEYPTPLSAFLLVYLCKWFGFLGELYFNVACMAAMAGGLILVARNVRGWTSFADAFFPLLLLHFGSDNFVWESQFVNFLPSMLAASLLSIIVLRGIDVGPLLFVLSGAVILGLSLSGPAGLVYVPGMSLWLSVVAIRSSNKRSLRNGAALVVGLALLVCALAFTAYCFSESRRALEGQFREPPPSVREAVWTTLQMASMWAGNANPFWYGIGLATAGLVSISVATLVREWVTIPQNRGAAFGLALYLGSACLLVIGMGMARSAFPPPQGLQAHYVPHVVAIPLAVFLLFCRIGPGARRPIFQFGLMTFLVVMLPFNTRDGIAMGHRLDEGCRAFERDLRAGLPADVLAERHSRFFFDLEERNYPLFEGMFSDSIRHLHKARIGVFAALNDPGGYREQKLLLDAMEIYQATWLDGVFRGNGSQAFITFALEQPTFVYGVRLNYAYADNERVTLRAAWKQGDLPYSETDRTDRIDFDPLPQTWGATWEGHGIATVWINDTIDRLRLYPSDRGGEFHLHSVTLLLPVEKYPLGTRLEFGRESSRAFLGDGWHEADGRSRWSSGDAKVHFRLDRAQPLTLRFRATALGNQRLVIVCNGHGVFDQIVPGDRQQVFAAPLLAEAIAESNTLQFITPAARAPGGEDERVLGVAVEWLDLVPRG